MGLTSFGYVRRRWFELFFTVHHLYVLFLLFLFWHLGEKNGLVFMLPGVFLFAFDRLQRAFQSWSYAGVMATKTMPDGSIQVGIRTLSDGRSETIEFWKGLQSVGNLLRWFNVSILYSGRLPGKMLPKRSRLSSTTPARITAYQESQ
jgi:hypothetical protein